MQVYKGLRRGVQEVAVKKLARNTAEDVWFKLLTNEIDVLKKVRLAITCSLSSLALALQAVLQQLHHIQLLTTLCADGWTGLLHTGVVRSEHCTVLRRLPSGSSIRDAGHGIHGGAPCAECQQILVMHSGAAWLRHTAF